MRPSVTRTPERRFASRPGPLAATTRHCPPMRVAALRKDSPKKPANRGSAEKPRLFNPGAMAHLNGTATSAGAYSMTDIPDNDAFATILTLLHRRARTLVACPAEAADLAQDTALKLWQRLGDGAEPDDLAAYAMTALRNQARSHWRARKPWQELREDMATTQPEAPCRIACAELRAALTRLPKTQGELMGLVASGETSPAALARITGQPLGTVMSRLARARATLRADMGLEQTEPVRALYASECDS